MTDPADLKVAILSFAHVHAAAYAALLQTSPGVVLRATDPGPYPAGEQRGADFARSLGIDYVDTVDELLAWQPDIAIVTSENARHRELVEAAANAGANILCEKPLATTWEDGQAIASAVARAGVIFMVAFPVRFSSAFAELRAAEHSGALGELVAVRGSNNGTLPQGRSWFTDPALSGGGALVDHVVHIADLLDALMDAAPTTVTAVANRVLHADEAGAETAGLVTIRYDNGVIAAIDCSWSMPDTAPVWGGLTLTVVGTGGTVDLNFFGAAAHGLDTQTGHPIEARYGPNFDDAMLHTFLEAVRRQDAPQPDITVGLRTLSIVLAAQQSARTGDTIAIASITNGQ